MTDFSKILEEIVSLEHVFLNEAKGRPSTNYDPAAPIEGGSTEARRATASAAIKELRKLQRVVEKYMKEVDEDLTPLLDAAKTKLGEVQKQFGGLMHMTEEQQSHIETMTTLANKRIDKLKETVEELTGKLTSSSEKDTQIAGLKRDKAASDKLAADKEAEVQRLTTRVSKLETDLQAKETEMETQRVEYEEVLDYYESIMIKMKKAQMEAERHLKNMEVELGMDYPETTKTKGKMLSETRDWKFEDYFDTSKKKQKNQYDW